jgi:AbrB family looped-hinge helix DNA binding protein
MNQHTHKVRVTESGRMSIPADIRRAMGLEKGGYVQLKLDDDGLHLETPHQFVKRIQKMARDAGWHDKLNVDDFLAWRREQAKHEEEEADRKRW